MPRRWFRRVLAVALFLGMLVLLLRLGFWQIERAEFKEGLLQRYAETEVRPPQELSLLMRRGDASHWEFGLARTTGTFMADRQYLLDNQTHGGKAGYLVLTPLSSPDGSVLVNRGWVPVGVDRRVPPDVGVGDGATAVTGRLVQPPRPGLLLGSDGYEGTDWPRVVQTVDLPRMSEQIGRRLMPAILQLDSQHEACHICDWRPVKSVSPQRHRGYAVQWFSLAGTLVVLMAIVSWKEVRRERV